MFTIGSAIHNNRPATIMKKKNAEKDKFSFNTGKKKAPNLKPVMSSSGFLKLGWLSLNKDRIRKIMLVCALH